MEVPALERMPELLPHERYILELFVAVSSSRPPAFGEKLAPIPVTEIAAAYGYLGVDDHLSPLDWMKTVQNLDAALREHIESTRTRHTPPR